MTDNKLVICIQISSKLKRFVAYTIEYYLSDCTWILAPRLTHL